MAYTLDEFRLRVVRQLSKEHIRYLRGVRLLILEHILPTTEEFVKHVTDAGAEIFCLLAKPYSVDASVLSRLEAQGIAVTRKSYKELDETAFLDDLLHKAIDTSKSDNRKIVVVDVGGYFAAPLSRLNEDDATFFAGVVEDTTFGHNRYLASVDRLRIPVFSVARSALKEIEARYVGKDAVTAMDLILRRSGVSTPGRTALVIGYGMIGRNVARSLSATDHKVCVYDILDHKNLAAFTDGFAIHKKEELLKHADIIYAATGNPKGAMSFDEIADSKDNVILVSVGSRDTEFDVEAIRKQSLKCERVDPDLVRYEVRNSHNVIVARDGTAINFSLPSIPVEVLDLVFSELLSCVIALMQEPRNFPLGRIHAIEDPVLSEISKIWLRFVNR